MNPLDDTTKFGTGQETTAEALAVTCPHCRNTIFSETVGTITCPHCNESVVAKDHYGETCQAIECADCGTVITTILENQLILGNRIGYMCYDCHTILAFETTDSLCPPHQMLTTEWIFNGQSLPDRRTKITENCWMIREQTAREQFAVHILNDEAASTSSFRSYKPDKTETNAHLCFTNDHCIGYLTWTWEDGVPALRQLYLLPSYRQQGIGSAFVTEWRNEIAGQSEEYLVDEPNENMLRLLRSIGDIELTDDEIQFKNCGWIGSYIGTPDEWRSES